MSFSTVDNDNDGWGDNCAKSRGDAGNWWGQGCGHQNINGKYGHEGAEGEEALKVMNWYHFENKNMALKTMKLMIRPAV